jgi:hypothetical protein
VSLSRASGEKCFLNSKGFRKFFECNPNNYAKDFVGGGVQFKKNFGKDFTWFLTKKKLFFVRVTQDAQNG